MLPFLKQVSIVHCWKNHKQLLYSPNTDDLSQSSLTSKFLKQVAEIAMKSDITISIFIIIVL